MMAIEVKPSETEATSPFSHGAILPRDLAELP
jgi:hypothetical protein